MAALSHDYKAQRRIAPDSRRLRDFGYGAACGAALAGLACAWLGARAHTNPVQPPPAHTTPVTKSEPTGSAAEPLTFPDMLARTTVPVFPTGKDQRRAPPPAPHGPTR